MRNLIYNDLLARVPVFVVDFKRDLELAEKLAGWCAELGVKFTHVIDTPNNEYRVKSNPAGPSYYDPLAGLDADAKADVILNLRKWDTAADVYRSHMQAALTLLFNVLEEVEPFFTDPKVSKLNLHRLGDLKRFETIIGTESALHDLLTVLPPTSLKYAEFDNFVQAVTTGRSNDQKHAYDTLRVQMRNITQSGFGRWLAVDERHTGLDLYKLSSTPGVVLFSIKSGGAEMLAASLGSVILQHMTNVSGWRQSQRVSDQYLAIYVDEFAVVNPLTVKDLLERGRSAKACVTLSLQSFQQVVSAAEKAGEALLQGYIDTMTNFIIHSGINYSTAEFMSNIFGKEVKAGWQFQHLGDAGGNAKASQTAGQEAWVLDPTSLTKLRGPRKASGSAPEAFYITKNSADPKHPGRRSVKVEAVVPDYVSSNDGDGSFRMEVAPPPMEFVAEMTAAALAPIIAESVAQNTAYGVGKTFNPQQEEQVGVESGDSEEQEDGGFTFTALDEGEEDLDLLAMKLRDLASRDSLTPEEREWAKRVVALHRSEPSLREALREGKALKDARKAKQVSYNRFEEGLPALPSPGTEPMAEEKPHMKRFNQGF